MRRRDLGCRSRHAPAFRALPRGGCGSRPGRQATGTQRLAGSRPDHGHGSPGTMASSSGRQPSFQRSACASGSNRTVVASIPQNAARAHPLSSGPVIDAWRHGRMGQPEPLSFCQAFQGYIRLCAVSICTGATTDPGPRQASEQQRKNHCHCTLKWIQ